MLSAHRARMVPEVYLQSKEPVGLVHFTLSSGQKHGMRLQDADADAAIDKFRRGSYSAASASNAPEQLNGRSSQGSQVCTSCLSIL